MASDKWAAGARSTKVPRRVCDALAEVLGADDRDLTPDSSLVADLGADEMDLVEVGLLLGVEDACLDWVTVKDVVRSAARAEAAQRGMDL